LEVLKTSSGWYYLSFLKPQAVFDYKWFYLFWAATFLVASIPRISWLKSFFETRFNQYLGRISFALYLVHGPVILTLGDRLYVAAGWPRESHRMGVPDWINLFPISKAGPLGLELSFLLPHLIILPVTLWVAEIVTKLLDKPTVKFAQWAYGRMLPAPSPKS
jgi:peptidoglycan/LPS O-acetylase OafA/YrhL